MARKTKAIISRANELLTRIEDLKKVKGWKDLTATPGWEDDFTLNSTGPVDVMWASRAVLLALPGMNDSHRRSFSRFAAEALTKSKARRTISSCNRSRKCERLWVCRRNNSSEIVAPDWFQRPGGANHQHRQIRISYARWYKWWFVKPETFRN